MYSFCTLFDSNYLDKGLVTINSLQKYIEQEKIYVLAMDEKCYAILTNYYASRENVIIISLKEFENDELKEIKKTRSRAEYCWTCSASLIAYVLEYYKEEYCTYIDADLCFYSDPRCVIQEMDEQNKTVQIIEHRFRMNYDGKLQQLNSGRFCVEFMTFKNVDSAKRVLDVWRKQIIGNCSASMDMNTFGDQMYLNSWEEDYDCVWVTRKNGAGVAPWNFNRYKFSRISEKRIMLFFDEEKEEIPLIFYHFHHISYICEDEVNINVRIRYWKVDEHLVQKLYVDYLREVEKQKDFLAKKYGFRPMYRAIKKAKKEKIDIYGILTRPKFVWRMRYTIENTIRIALFTKKDIIDLGSIKG